MQRSKVNILNELNTFKQSYLIHLYKIKEQLKNKIKKKLSQQLNNLQVEFSRNNSWWKNIRFIQQQDYCLNKISLKKFYNSNKNSEINLEISLKKTQLLNQKKMQKSKSKINLNWFKIVEQKLISFSILINLEKTEKKYRKIYFRKRKQIKISFILLFLLYFYPEFYVHVNNQFFKEKQLNKINQKILQNELFKYKLTKLQKNKPKNLKSQQYAILRIPQEVRLLDISQILQVIPIFKISTLLHLLNEGGGGGSQSLDQISQIFLT
ncbi:transmembrane protein, putative (macronuclear) [Tetrahymena thermophila SB210]|uniref:Transmembrane protein, putative n=1 Tax=Tetrahymena thermophila (strain SB210) TaxID=312017 RepID=W7XIQ0_TETTS|nr:transmembrane protein, putative [Tetrahymena thermophila SB210]EWS74801.1 transmembrane protein, putative [Tetrahymena thermophila SB210]|eukprot:XP_012652694.1 transmembrane protein, putative [Tetrahymena thermophila SB210]